ncbi:hypothetical protein BBD41_01300 [Paenibacillus ihbetae]|uniref:Uncharacterized protein n=1 Tax=Paenibacillus ihbetae TaxID=1870820 RepID=A0A1B2DUE8_9BACL|nr:hypothetical protein BBD41_01300 [Paenibacillus ihbetae]
MPVKMNMLHAVHEELDRQIFLMLYKFIKVANMLLLPSYSLLYAHFFKDIKAARPRNEKRTPIQPPGMSFHNTFENRDIDDVLEVEAPPY